jgi:hypothetical protein
MAKGRMLNKRISKSDKIAALVKDRHRTLYFMIYPHLDRDGRYSADPRDIKEDCVPRLKYSLDQISESLQALNDVGLITIYTINGKQFLEASRFDDFQVGLHKDREAPSEIPPNPGPSPDNSGNCRTDAEIVPLNLNLKVNLNLKEKVKDSPPSTTSESVESDPLKTVPKEFIDSAVEGIKKTFEEGGHSALLEDQKFFTYLVALCWEYKDLDHADEIKGKFAHWIKWPMKEKSNLCLQFRNWFRNGRRFAAERAKERQVGRHRPEK